MQNDDQETEWIRRCRAGDKEAFGYLVKKYMKQAYYAALGFVGSHEDALDASQEAFVKAFRAIDTFESGKRFYTWYYQILRNHCLNMLRSRKGAAVSMSLIAGELDEVQSDEPHAETQMQLKETRKSVWEALWRLAPDDRSLIVARDMLDTPYATLAELLECPVGTVMSRLYYARKRLRSQLERAL
ncbi:MAG: sigma-70 family RNA polymerase sigma factor [Bacteroidetes bacterium]|nr:sigma-70 family RNA polymerase sigma factor [Bacteroidota bacterium]MCW5895689.1 sigma-70 family RNA polymerase sigma factor [Bacteroidota bacterium]